MELRPLVDVDLREVLAPINRAARGEFLPTLRTVAQLRERVALGVLDLKLSRACYVGGSLGATCLVEHLADESVAHIDALASEPLAQQRGAVRAVVDAVQSAAALAGVSELTVFVSEMDSTLGAALQAAGFTRRQAVARYALAGPPSALPLPVDVDGVSEPPTSGTFVRAVSLPEALPMVSAVEPSRLLYAQRSTVLQKLAARLSVLQLYTVAETGGTAQPEAALVFDRERKSLCALGGETAALASLIALAATRHGIAYLDAIAETHPAVSALQAAGYVRSAMRVELTCDPRAVLAGQKNRAVGPTDGPGKKGAE